MYEPTINVNATSNYRLVPTGKANLETKKKSFFFDIVQLTFIFTSVYRRYNVFRSTISWFGERVNVTGTLPCHLRISLLHVSAR